MFKNKLANCFFTLFTIFETHQSMDPRGFICDINEYSFVAVRLSKGLKNDGRPFERRYFTKEQVPEADGSSFYNYFAEGCATVCILR